MFSVFGLLFVFTSLFPARPSSTSYPRGESSISLTGLQHTIENQEAEIRTLDEKLSTQDAVLDALRQKIMDLDHTNREFVKGNAIALEKKVLQLDSTINQIQEEIRSLRAHHKQKTEELESQVASLRKGIEKVLAAIEGESSPREAEGTYYEVKAGDSLDKIAKKYKISLKQLKEWNNLKGDKIFKGQKLRIS